MRRLALPISAGDHVCGPLEATVTLLEYGDYECSNCESAHYVVQKVRQRSGDCLRFVFRHFPLAAIHPHAQCAAETVEAAAAQGQFWPMHDYLYEHRQHCCDGAILRYAAVLGLDADRFEREIAEHQHAARVHSDLMSGFKSGVNGTPTFFIDGVRYDGPCATEALLAAIEGVYEQRSV